MVMVKKVNFNDNNIPVTKFLCHISAFDMAIFCAYIHVMEP